MDCFFDFGFYSIMPYSTWLLMGLAIRLIGMVRLRDSPLGDNWLRLMCLLVLSSRIESSTACNAYIPPYYNLLSSVDVNGESEVLFGIGDVLSLLSIMVRLEGFNKVFCFYGTVSNASSAPVM